MATKPTRLRARSLAATSPPEHGDDGQCVVAQGAQPAKACLAPQPAASKQQQQQQGGGERVAEFDSSQAVVCRVGLLGQDYWRWLWQADNGHPRFFANPFLEACSKTPWWVIPLLWLPLFTYCFARAHLALDVPASALPAWLMAGVLAWQLLEYTIHRFVFHARSTSYWGITFHFLFHGCHHKYPMDHLRLVFPPVPASALIAAVYYTLHALLPPCHALPLFAGMGYGYVAYDCMHYVLHHHGAVLKGGMLQDLRNRHMHHHFKNSTRGFGISSVLYDVVFRTSS